MEEADAEDILDKGEVPKLVKSVQEIQSLVSILKCQICYDFMVSDAKVELEIFSPGFHGSGPICYWALAYEIKEVSQLSCYRALVYVEPFYIWGLNLSLVEAFQVSRGPFQPKKVYRSSLLSSRKLLRK